MPSIYVFFHNWAAGETYMPLFFQQNREKFAENGIIYGWDGQDPAIGCLSQQNLLARLAHLRNTRQQYSEFLQEALAQWQKRLASGDSILLSFRARNAAREFLALYSLFHSHAEFKKYPQKYFFSLGRPDYYMEWAARANPQFSVKDIQAHLKAIFSYLPLEERAGRMLAPGDYVVRFPQFSPFTGNDYSLRELARDFLEFCNIKDPDSFNYSVAMPVWTESYLRKIVDSMNNAWKKPAQEELAAEASSWGCPQRISALGFAHLLEVEQACRLKWEEAAKRVDEKTLWLPLHEPDNPGCMRINSPEISSYVAANWRLAPLAMREAAKALLPDSAAMPASPEMAVLTLAYNHEDYIGQCIESVRDQERDFSLEHIIVDDRSNDATREIISDYASRYPHIRPIFLERKTAGANVTALFRACGSKYAALCDGDDYFIDKRKLQKQRAYLEENPDCSICGHYVNIHFDYGDHEDFLYPPANLLPKTGNGKYCLDDMFMGNFLQTNSVMYRWRFREEVPAWFRPEICPGDWYWHLLHAETGKIGFIPEVMSVYRRHKTAMYSHAFLSAVDHRRDWGMRELAAFDVVDNHFNGGYFDRLASLANAIFAHFLQIQLNEDDDRLLNLAADKYPKFAIHFLEQIKKGEIGKGQAGE